jgi:hypothetical protein
VATYEQKCKERGIQPEMGVAGEVQRLEALAEKGKGPSPDLLIMYKGWLKDTSTWLENRQKLATAITAKYEESLRAAEIARRAEADAKKYLPARMIAQFKRDSIDNAIAADIAKAKQAMDAFVTLLNMDRADLVALNDPIAKLQKEFRDAKEAHERVGSVETGERYLKAFESKLAVQFADPKFRETFLAANIAGLSIGGLGLGLATAPTLTMAGLVIAEAAEKAALKAKFSENESIAIGVIASVFVPESKLVSVGKSTLTTLEKTLALTESKAVQALYELSTKKPYNPLGVRAFLEEIYGKTAVKSSTVPAAHMPNVKLANKEFVVIEKCAEYPNGLKIMYNQRGMPVYDKYAAYDTKISMDVVKIENRNKHFKAASLDLKRAIEKGEVPRSNFTDQQIIEIMAGESKITGYTWHHHEDVGRMQLIPEVLHKESAHIGGMGLWYQKFSEGAK